tara:strand:+ start:1449 stop:2267 length:819 start_codon:yes stop_codon:yes gene_type:complete
MNNLNFYKETFKKDLKIALSYRIQFIFSIFSIFISIFFIFIFSNLFESGNSNILDRYGGSYFIFLLIGFITAEVTFFLLNTMPNKVREYQLTGIFEELIMSGRKEVEIILGCLLYPSSFQVMRLLVYAICLYFTPVDLSLLSNLSLVTLISFIIFCISIVGISLISAAVTITYKAPSIINSIYLSVTSILSGVAFPVELLPRFLIILGEFLPSTQFLKIIRSDAVLEGNALDLNFIPFLLLICMTITLFLLGIYLINKSITIAKKNGNLLQY